MRPFIRNVKFLKPCKINQDNFYVNQVVNPRHYNFCKEFLEHLESEKFVELRWYHRHELYEDTSIPHCKYCGKPCPDIMPINGPNAWSLAKGTFEPICPNCLKIK